MVRIGMIALMVAFVAWADEVVLDDGLHHLGDSTVKGWAEWVPIEAEGRKLSIPFDAAVNTSEWAVSLNIRDVDSPWVVRLNGRTLGIVKKQKNMRRVHFPVAPKMIREKGNELVIMGQKKNSRDDVIAGSVRLHKKSLKEVLQVGVLRLNVTDSEGKGLPARVTIVDENGALAVLRGSRGDRLALRQGIVYLVGEGEIFLSAGNYRVYATRGFEWSLDQKSVTVVFEDSVGCSLSLRREVDTKGLIACDTHIHTLTYSGHGDATMDERVVTLAGEGIELAIATDHNHHTDYEPLQNAMSLNKWFKPVVGNEVTTRLGHFNAFPMDPKGPIPDHKEPDWVKLVQGMRDHGAKAVILNHPRWPSIERGPFGKFGIDQETGKRKSGPAFTFDAIEVTNSTALLQDPLFTLRDWFGLLNNGELMTAVGASDSHTVGDPVGQARTYFPSVSDVPTEIDVDATCDALLRGDCSVSMGILAQATLNGSRMGSVVDSRQKRQLAVRIAAPAWIEPSKLFVYVNGKEVHQEPVRRAAGKVTDYTVRHDLAAVDRDAWVVCVVLGEGVANPGWPTWQPYTIAVTNPIYLDADGDGKYLDLR